MIKYVVVVAFLVGYWAVSALLRTMKERENRHKTAGAQSAGPGTGQERASGATGSSRDEEPWYQVLGVRPDSSWEDITRAYRKRIAQYHPDRVQDLAPDIVALAEREAKRINAAFSLAKSLRNTS